MSLFLLVPVLVAAALAAIVVMARVPRDAAPGVDVETSPDAYARARRHAALVASLSWTALVVVAVVLPQAIASGPDRGIVLGCALAGAGVAALLVAAVGERTWPRPDAPVRRASLVRRTARDVAPRALAGLVLGWSAALLLVLLATGLSADADGRSVTFAVDASRSSSAGPYPGAPYGAPIALATVVLLAGTAATLHLVAARPAVARVSTADDDRLRRASAGRVLAAVQLTLGCTLAGVLLFTGNSLRAAATTQWAIDDVWSTSTDPVGHALGIAGLVASPGVLLVTLVVTGVTLARAAREVAGTSPAATVPV